jgi:hypothetical protein
VKQWENRSPDGKFSVFAKNHNLYLYSVSDSSGIKPITIDGELYYGYGRVSDAFFQKNKNRDFGSPQESNTIWSSDSRQTYFFRSDYRKVKDLWVINSLSRPRPELISYKSRLPGEPLPHFNHAIYNLDLNQIVEIEEEKWNPDLFREQVWSRDSQRLYMVRMRPDQMKAEVVSVNPATGKMNVLWEEKPGALVLTRPIVELKENGGLLWWSRRSGWGHYYVYDK